MTMPGFNAETSLYKTSRHYRIAGIPNDLAGSRGVLPQLRNLGTTREVCTAFGCTASFFNCDCGNSRRKLDCILSRAGGVGT